MVADLDTTPLFTEVALRKRVAELGAAISRDYAGEPVTMVCVLKGAFMFAADLIRTITVPVKIEFIGVQSYEGTKSTGRVRITHDLGRDIHDKNVLLVEDIIDTGRTIDYLLETLRARGPKTIRVCTLLSKPEAHIMKHRVDYTGFEISKEFVIGYGLDLDGKYRELPYIAQVKT